MSAVVADQAASPTTTPELREGAFGNARALSCRECGHQVELGPQFLGIGAHGAGHPTSAGPGRRVAGSAAPRPASGPRVGLIPPIGRTRDDAMTQLASPDRPRYMPPDSESIWNL